MVYVRLRPHRQLSLCTQSPNKLAKCYFGPFRIMEHIGSVAYRLQLPDGSKIHPVFHCSMLRPHHGPLELQTSALPPDAFHNQPILEPLTILDSRMNSLNDQPTHLVLVQWVGLAPEESTWEKWEDICKSHHLEDKVIFSGWDNDSTNSRENREDISLAPEEAHKERP